jgi:hypothetical protein
VSLGHICEAWSSGYLRNPLLKNFEICFELKPNEFATEVQSKNSVFNNSKIEDDPPSVKASAHCDNSPTNRRGNPVERRM